MSHEQSDFFACFPNLLGLFAFVAALVSAAFMGLAIKLSVDADMARPHHYGARCQVIGTSATVVLIDKHGHLWTCRVDNGVGTSPRFTTAQFGEHELSPIDTKVEP